MHVLVTCKYKKDRIKNNREKVETSFTPLLVNGGFLLPWKPEFLSNLPKTLHSLSPTPVMLYIKFDQHWPTGLRFKFGSVDNGRTTTDGRRTIGIL